MPEGVSLIVDGGVTVFASRTPSNYQVSGNVATCGTDAATAGGCNPLLSFTNSSGVYGYGILDGRGNSIMNNGSGNTWWDLIAAKIGQTKKSINENNPEMIAAAGNNFTLYKITIRNPPWHTVNWGGTGLTVWGVKIQAPWNVTNTDGFDIHGSSVTIYDTTISNGDDDIAFSSGGAPTSEVTVDHLHVYSRDGITFLGNGDSEKPISKVLIKNMTMTGDVPSVVGATVNGMSETDVKSRFNLSSFTYTQALPSATGEIHGVNIKPTPNVKPAGDTVTDSPTGATINSVTFRSICMQDIQIPFSIVPQTPYSSSNLPTVDQIAYQDIHVLAPTSQFPDLLHGRFPQRYLGKSVRSRLVQVVFRGGSWYWFHKSVQFGKRRLRRYCSRRSLAALVADYRKRQYHQHGYQRLSCNAEQHRYHWNWQHVQFNDIHKLRVFGVSLSIPAPVYDWRSLRFHRKLAGRR